MFVSLCLKHLRYFCYQCLSRGKWCLTATSQKSTWECAASGLSLWRLIQREGKDAEFLSLQLAFVSESYFGKNETELFIGRILRSDKRVFQKLPGCAAEAERCQRVSLRTYIMSDKSDLYSVGGKASLQLKATKTYRHPLSIVWSTQYLLSSGSLAVL